MRELRRRWRLVLGPHSEESLSGQGNPQDSNSCLQDSDEERDRLLEYLYRREYRDRQFGGDDRAG